MSTLPDRYSLVVCPARCGGMCPFALLNDSAWKHIACSPQDGSKQARRGAALRDQRGTIDPLAIPPASVASVQDMPCVEA